MVGVGDRPAPGQGPEDGPGVPVREAGAGAAEAGGAGPVRAVRAYCRIRFGDDPHLWATTLFDEVGELGYTGAYRRSRGRCGCGGCGRGARSARRRGRRRSSRSSVTRRARRPSGTGSSCRTRRRGGGGGRTRTCWSGRCRTRARGAGCSRSPRSSRTWSRALHGACERLGGVTRRWRFDRMSTVCHPETGDLTAVVRGGREVLRGRGGRVPVAARLAQGRGGEGEPLRGAAVVADAAR